MKKDACLFNRDEKGELVPQEVPVEIDENDEEQKKYEGETIVITPMPRGEVRRLFGTITDKKKDDSKEDEKDLDGEIVLKHCKNPLFTEEDMPFVKPSYLNMIANTILRESGLNTGKSKKKALEEKEDDFGKN